MRAIIPHPAAGTVENGTPVAVAVVARPAGIGRSQTSVPHAAHVGVDRYAAEVVAVAFGDVGGALDDLDAAATIHRVPSRFDNAASELVARLLGRARVGLRLVLAGPHDAVYAARSVALAAGAIPDEIVCRVTDAEPVQSDGVAWPASGSARRVFCGHCHRTMSAVVSVGDAVDCASCGRTLVVRYHYSRRHAAFLGSLIRR